jgi:hypothetical protein
MTDLETLQSLPRLSARHYAHYTHSSLLLQVADEGVKWLAWITGSVTLYSSANDLMFENAIKVAKLTGASLCITHSPYHNGWPADLPPTHVGPEVDAEVELFRIRMAHFKTLLAAVNKRLRSHVRVSCIILNAERFQVRADDDAWNAAIDAKYLPFWNICKKYFPAAWIEWFERGMVYGVGRDFRKPWFTLREPGPAYSASLYWMQNWNQQEAAIAKTLLNANKHGQWWLDVWLALGETWLMYAGAERWVKDVDYDPPQAWQLGANLWWGHNLTRSPSFTAAWGRVRHGFFYPAAFESPFWVKHFAAYVRGSKGIAL